MDNNCREEDIITYVQFNRVNKSCVNRNRVNGNHVCVREKIIQRDKKTEIPILFISQRSNLM